MQKLKTKFKQTEIRKIPEDWEFKPLNGVVEINPKRDLKKGTKSKYVSMQDLKEFNKKIQGFIFRNFNGGSKFQNGDTVMARITPCLENGKTAFVDILDEKEIAAGSTEFIVLSGKEGETINGFVYYLSRSPKMRADAIASMTGTSGRQRVQTDLLGIKEVLVPPISEQKIIVKILSDLDAKIELNKKINQILESFGQTLFKKWFVDERKKEWEIKKIKDIVADKKYAIVDGPFGTQLHNEEYVSEGIPVIRIINLSFDGHFINESLVFITEEKFDSLKRSAIYPGDILLAKTGATIGKFSITPNYVKNGIIASSVLKISPKEINRYYLYYIIKNLSDKKYWESVSSGSTRSTINLIDVRDIEIIIPNSEILDRFESLMGNFFKLIENNNIQSQKLSQIRDLLLPQLMSGEIRVK